MVAIGAPYATRAELKREMGIPDSNVSQDALIDSKLITATSDINRFCHRQFGRDEVASVRTFEIGPSGVDVDDIWDRSDITIAPYAGVTAGTPVSLSSLQLEPLNGIVDGIPGWPVERLAYLSCFPSLAMFGYYSTWRVTAKWGWESVPAGVKEACIMLANSGMNAKGAPFGVAAFGDYAVRLRQNPMAAEKLEPYRKDQYLVAT